MGGAGRAAAAAPGAGVWPPGPARGCGGRRPRLGCSPGAALARPSGGGGGGTPAPSGGRRLRSRRGEGAVYLRQPAAWLRPPPPQHAAAARAMTRQKKSFNTMNEQGRGRGRGRAERPSARARRGPACPGPPLAAPGSGSRPATFLSSPYQSPAATVGTEVPTRRGCRGRRRGLHPSRLRASPPRPSPAAIAPGAPHPGRRPGPPAAPLPLQPRISSPAPRALASVHSLLCARPCQLSRPGASGPAPRHLPFSPSIPPSPQAPPRTLLG